MSSVLGDSTLFNVKTLMEQLYAQRAEISDIAVEISKLEKNVEEIVKDQASKTSEEDNEEGTGG